MWTLKNALLLALLIRLLLVCYGRIHDALIQVKFTDIDYRVVSDAADYLREGRSSFDRHTYRYTPLLAILLLPNASCPDFGKLLFNGFDLLAGYLIYLLVKCSYRDKWLGKSTAKHSPDLEVTTSNISNAADELESLAVQCACIWLFNPLTAIVSSRGNADSIVSAAVLGVLFLLLRDGARPKWTSLVSAAFVHGFAIHFKIYPVIYLPLCYLYLIRPVGKSTAYITDWCLRALTNWRGHAYVMLVLASAAAWTLLFYVMFGEPYLQEAVLYHVGRTDPRHNFSPYFYLIYLSDGDVWWTKVVGLTAFLPQAAATVWFALRYHSDPSFCCFITTFAFVTLNKVCTSQYFIWYLCLLPVVYLSIRPSLSARRALFWLCLWAFAQALWLFSAYLLEFQGYNTFMLIWLCSLFFLVVNCCVLRWFLDLYRDSVELRRLFAGDERKTE